MQIETAVPEDKAWAVKLLSEVVNDGSAIWWRVEQKPKADALLVVRPVAVAHYSIRRDGWKILQEIAVRSDSRRQGLATALLKEIGTPVKAKTDLDNIGANNFYLAMGFAFGGGALTRNGSKMMNCYFRVAPYD
jgi:GNAT superfamily N-acetyltransferase